MSNWIHCSYDHCAAKGDPMSCGFRSSVLKKHLAFHNDEPGPWYCSHCCYEMHKYELKKSPEPLVASALRTVGSMPECVYKETFAKLYDTRRRKKSTHKKA